MRLWHNPGPALVEDDASHKRRGSLGGEDYRMGVGTPLYAPADGVIRARNGGTGGWTASLKPDGHPDIAAIEAMHLSGFNGLVLGGASRRVREGDLIGWSGGAKGAAGAGASTGPHCHEHVDLAGGGRTGLGLYIAAHGGSIGGNATSIPAAEQSEEDIMGELSNETKKFITDTVHDQVRSLLVEDQKNGEKSVVEQITAKVIRAVQNESRYRLFRLKDGPRAGRIFLRDLDSGRELEYTSLQGLDSDQRQDKALQLLGPGETQVEITQRQYDRLLEASVAWAKP